MEVLSWVLFVAFVLYAIEHITIPFIVVFLVVGVLLLPSSPLLAALFLIVDGIITALWVTGRFLLADLV